MSLNMRKVYVDRSSEEKIRPKRQTIFVENVSHSDSYITQPNLSKLKSGLDRERR